jgi:hypothetical protein
MLQKMLESMTFHEVIPQASLQRSPPLADASCEDGLHVMTRLFYLINECNSRLNINLFDSIANDWLYIFLG